ncbi:hypothetical protein BY996DRAFT_6610894 [Phakopsora pachyrhizi]|nr:hypothetical protein BY996DRAFT_6610894 [Phakopsora pachyrhizi]
MNAVWYAHEGVIDASHNRHEKYQKRIGTGWDGRRLTKEPAGTGGGIITGPTKQGDKRWRRVDNHRANEARKL